MSNWTNISEMCKAHCSLFQEKNKIYQLEANNRTETEDRINGNITIKKNSKKNRWSNVKLSVLGKLWTLSKIIDNTFRKTVPYFLKFLLLFNYSCPHFLPTPPPHPSQTHLPPPPPPSPLILSSVFTFTLLLGFLNTH